MKFLGFILVLALLAIVGGWISERSFTTATVATTQAEPVSVSAAQAARR